MNNRKKWRMVWTMIGFSAAVVIAVGIIGFVQRGDGGDEVTKTDNPAVAPSEEPAAGSSSLGVVKSAARGAVVTPTSQGVVSAATRTAGAASPAMTGLAGDVAAGEGGIWVTGTGEVTMEPDLAVLHLGVETYEQTVSEANAGAANAMDSVMDALRSNGVAERDLQTHSYNVWPQYEWEEVTENGRRVSKQKLIGYRVANGLKAKVRDLDTVGDLIDRVVSAGGDATRFHGLQFTVEDTSGLMEDLREQAVLDAKEKAQHIADTAGVALGSLGYIADQPVRTFSTWDAPQTRADAMALSSAAASTPISGGELEVSLTVHAAFAIQ